MSAINNNIIIIIFHRSYYDAFYCWVFIFILFRIVFVFFVAFYQLLDFYRTISLHAN